MKILLPILLILGIIIVPTMGFRDTFQGWLPQDMTLQGASKINLTNSSAGEVLVWSKPGSGGNFLNSNSVPTDYIAFDTRNTTQVHLYDAASGDMGFLNVPCGNENPYIPGRIEIREQTNVPHLYCNGTAYSNYAYHSSLMSYVSLYPVGYAASYFDNVIMGETDHHLVAAPPSNWSIKYGVVTPAATGIYAADPETGILTLQNPTSFYISADTGSQDGLGVENFYITNATGATINTTTLNSASPNHLVKYDLPVFMNEAQSIPGVYGAHFQGSSVYDYFTLSAPAQSQVWGSSVWYTIGDTVTTTYSINASIYDPTDNYYNVVIQNASVGTILSTTPVYQMTGASSYVVKQTDLPGAMYQELTMAPKLPVGSPSVILNYAPATIQQYSAFNGYVNDAQYQSVINGAVLTFTQGSIVYSQTTGADGSYTTSGTTIANGTPMIINVAKSGYFTYNTSITPLSLQTYVLNISMNRTTPAYTGEAIGGIYRDGYLSNGMVYQGYGTPIAGGTILITNISTGESYTQTTNPFGWYMCDEGSSCVLTTKRPYNLVGSKLGYMTSTNYTAVAA